MKVPSLSGRMARLLGIVVVLILGIAALVMDQMVDARMKRHFDDSLLARAHELVSLMGLETPAAVAGNRVGVVGGKAGDAYTIRCAGGYRAGTLPSTALVPDGWMASASVRPTFADLRSGGRKLRAVWFEFTPPVDGTASARPGPCRLLLTRSRVELDEVLVDIDTTVVVVPAIALLVVLVLSLLVVRRGMEPLRALGEEMRGIGPQAMGQRLQATGTRELEPLVACFNEVLARMDEGVLRERQFAGALAHETRTRLAELRALVEVERRYPGKEPVATLLDEIGGIGSELESTVSGLLLLTRLDARIEDLDWRHVDIDELVSRQLERRAPLMQRRSLRIDSTRDASSAVLVADPSLLNIIIGNVLGNAAAYAPAGSVIDVHRQGGALVIRNDAPGLLVEEVARFGQRFWSKHHGTEGHAGLGLALAGAAAAAMDFRLAFQLSAQQQLSACLSWHPAQGTPAVDAGSGRGPV